MNDDFKWYLHELVVKYLKAKYPDIKLNYASFVEHFEKQSRKYEDLFSNMTREQFELDLKNEIEREIDRIMQERYFSLKDPNARRPR